MRQKRLSTKNWCRRSKTVIAWPRWQVVAKTFEVVIFTASQQLYADQAQLVGMICVHKQNGLAESWT